MQSIIVQTQVPFVVGPAESRRDPIGILGQQVLIQIHSSDTVNRFAVCHFTVPERSGPPEHVYTVEDEWFYVLKGEFTFLAGGKQTIAVSGATVFGVLVYPTPS